MHLIVNGDPYEHAGEGTLTVLLSALAADRDRVATMVNGDVVRKADRGQIRLNEGDRVELLTFAGGG